MSKQSEWPSTAVHPHPSEWQKATSQGVLSVSDIPPPQKKGRAVSSHTWSFCHPNCFWLTRLKPSKTLSNIVRVLRASVCVSAWQGGGPKQRWLRKWTCSTEGSGFPSFSGQQLADKCKRVRLESRQGRPLCCFYCNIMLFGADEVVATCHLRNKDTKDCIHAWKNISLTCLLGTQLLQTVGCCIITSGGRFPSCRHFFMCDYCPAGYS